ncbi:MAG: hypothetical protein DMF62_13965 [Acidobacteria bacterium]|nr:MAG: hypothetical protein DMF62_13965 [Acidobacteriota bacterium]
MSFGPKTGLFFIFVVAALVPASGYDNAMGTGARSLRWPKGPIKIAISTSLSAFGTGIRSGSSANEAFLRSLQKWEEVANIDFEIVSTEASAISPSGAYGDGISIVTIGSDSENILAFAKDNANAPALTRVFYDNHGQITEADMVLNPVQAFSSDHVPGTYDLETVFTHEIGHLLGLKHSYVPSAAMFDGVLRNSVVVFDAHPNTLSKDDVTKIRGLYGPPVSSIECCAAIKGKAGELSMAWLQDTQTGALVQMIRSNADGEFEFNGLEFGRYEVFAQPVDKDGLTPATDLGERKVDGIDTIPAIRLSANRTSSFALEYIGFTGQVSKRALRVSRGQLYRVTVAGKGLGQDGLSFGATTRKIGLTPLRLDTRDVPGGMSAVGLEMNIDSTIHQGQYSIFAEDRAGNRRYFVGAIWVE